MTKINFDDLRAANLARVEYFGHGSIDDGWNVAEWGCALAGETGELCNILKKMHRGADFDPHPDILRDMAAEEIADVMCYLDLLAAKLKIDIADVTQAKFNSVSRKYGYDVLL